MDDRETLELELNEFARFKPDIPPDYRGAEYVFLAASPPSTQLTVLNQMIAPKFVKTAVQK